MGLRGFATINFWADDVPAATAWYAEFLGVDAYFERPGPDGRPAYAEFRIGDSQDEFGIIDSNYRPAGLDRARWRGDALARRRPRGDGRSDCCPWEPQEYQPITPHGDSGLRHRLGRRPVRQRAGRHDQPALPRGARVQQGGLTWTCSTFPTPAGGSPGWQSSTTCRPRRGSGSARRTRGSRRSRSRKRSTWPSATGGSTVSARPTTTCRSSSGTRGAAPGARGRRSTWGRSRRSRRPGGCGRPGSRRSTAAKADGRWEAAYESQRNAEVPPDLAAALAGNADANAAFERLGRSDRYAVILPLLKARTPEARAKVLAREVARLAAQK